MSVNEAISVAQTLKETSENAAQTILGLQSEFNTGLEQMVNMKEYLESLCGMLETEGLPSYNEAVAQQKSEDVVNQMDQVLTSADIFQQHVVAVHELFDNLVDMLVAVTNRA